MRPESEFWISSVIGAIVGILLGVFFPSGQPFFNAVIGAIGGSSLGMAVFFMRQGNR